MSGALSGALLIIVLAFASWRCGGGGLTNVVPPPPNNPVPLITALLPSSAFAGDPAFTLSVQGRNFVTGVFIQWSGVGLTTVFVNGNELTASIPASAVTTAAVEQITVVNPGPGGGISKPLEFDIKNHAPILTKISPDSGVADGRPVALTATGKYFLSQAVILWNGGDFSTHFVNSSQLTTTIPGNLFIAGGTAKVQVFSGGVRTPALTFTINPTLPLRIATSSLPDSGGGKNYYFNLDTSGGMYPYHWSLAPGSQALPPGLTLDPTGLLSGTLSEAQAGQNYSFAIQVTDSASPYNIANRSLGLAIREQLGSNDACTAGRTSGTTAISNGRLRASISPYGDIDVYSFHGMQGAKVTIETFAQRLNLYNDPPTRDSQLDTVLELLDSDCNRLVLNDDIGGDPYIQDSLIKDFQLPSTGVYFIRVRDFRGDGRPDMIYDLSLYGAD
jgi:hypothetical protein